MKKIFLLLLMATPGMLFAQSKTNYQINGRFINAGDYKMVYLMHTEEGGYRQVTDSARVINGAYVLKGYTDGGTAMLTNFRLGSEFSTSWRTVQFFLAAGKFTINHTTEFKNIKIAGSKANMEYDKLQAQDKAYPGNGEINVLNTNLNKALSAKDTIAATPIYVKLQQLQNQKRETIYGAYFRANLTSPVAFYALQQYAGPAHDVDASIAERVKPMFDRLPLAVRASPSGKVYSDRLDTYLTFGHTTIIGNQAPDFELNDTIGKPVKLSAFRGKYVLLDFWASWCAPCRAESPNVLRAYKKYHDKGFDVLSVTMDYESQKAAWLQAIKHDKVGVWTHVADLQSKTNMAGKLYGVTGIPQNFLIDPDGKIIARSLRGEDLQKKLAEIIK